MALFSWKAWTTPEANYLGLPQGNVERGEYLREPFAGLDQLLELDRAMAAGVCPADQLLALAVVELEPLVVHEVDELVDRDVPRAVFVDHHEQVVGAQAFVLTPQIGHNTSDSKHQPAHDQHGHQVRTRRAARTGWGGAEKCAGNGQS